MQLSVSISALKAYIFLKLKMVLEPLAVLFMLFLFTCLFLIGASVLFVFHILSLYCFTEFLFLIL